MKNAFRGNYCYRTDIGKVRSSNEDETKITIDNNAYVGEYNGCKFFLRNIDPEKLTVIEEPIVFLYHCCPEKFYHSVSCLGPSPSGTLVVMSV